MLSSMENQLPFPNEVAFEACILLIYRRILLHVVKLEMICQGLNLFDIPGVTLAKPRAKYPQYYLVLCQINREKVGHIHDGLVLVLLHILKPDHPLVGISSIIPVGEKVGPIGAIKQ